MIDRLKQLAIFSKIIDHGSFRGAARELQLSPSVVSHHLSQLEEQLGVPLLYRSTRKLSLTPEGERLLKATQSMLTAVEGELQTLSATASEPSGSLRLTAPSVLSHSWLVDRIAAFAVRYPKIHLSLDFSDMRRELIDGGFDLAIRMGVQSKRSPTSRRLSKVRRCLVAATSFLDARPPVTHPKDIEGWDWLGLAPAHSGPMRFSKDGADPVDIRIRPRVRSNDAQALYSLARAGAGLAVIPEFLAQADAEAGRVTCVLPDWELPAVDVRAEWPANAPRHGLVHLALDALSDPG